MEQVIFGGKYNLLHATTTEYSTLIGGRSWSDAESYHRKLVSSNGKIKNLRVKLNDSPGSGTHYDFTLMLNGNPTALTLEIADTATSGSNVVNEIDVVAGDIVSLQCAPTDTPTARYATWTSMFEGATANESLILGGNSGNAVSNTATEYSQVMGSGVLYGTTENSFREVCPTSGTIKNLYVELSHDPGTAPDAYRFTLRKNGISQALTVTITADDTIGNDTVNEVTVAAGDVLTLMIEPLNTPSAIPRPFWGMTFVADVDGESIVMAGLVNALNSGVTEYHELQADWAGYWRGTESQKYSLGQSCILKKLYMLLSATPGAGKSYTFTLRKPGNGQADGNLTVTFADAATTGNDVAHEDAIADDDYVDLKCIPAGTPDTPYVCWGLVSLEPPIPTTPVADGDLIGIAIIRKS